MPDDATTKKKSYTPPKGQPTRARGRTDGGRRAFGPVAQWITLAAVIIVIVTIILIITNGGIFNDDPNDLNIPTSAPAALLVA